MDASRLPRRITRQDWERRVRGARQWPFWINSRPWHPLVRESPPGLYLPDGAHAKLSEADGDVLLPPGAVVVRSFNVVSHAGTNRPPKTDYTRPIETRLLVIGAPYGYGASYRWLNERQAELVEDGEFVTFSEVAADRGDGRPPKSVRINWWFPAADDAISFPIANPSYWVSTAASDFVVAPPASRSDTAVNWLAAMMRKNVLVTGLAPSVVSSIAPDTDWESPSMPLEARVRSYLHGNCAVCHQPGGASRGNFDARTTTPLTRTGLIDGEPAAGDLGIAGARLIVPGDPEKSILYQRVKRTDFFRMPPVAYYDEPSPILPVMEEWIRSLAPTR